jgi:hypothetical protein
MRSYDELLASAGYEGRPKEFDDLIRILDSEVRLITPTDPAGVDSDDDSAQEVQPGRKYYQLTHDYLLPSVREWLTRKQKETRRGRAQLRLAERASAWNAKRENRQLPAWWEYLDIRLLSNPRHWTEPQQKMMRRAGQVHRLRWGTSLLLALLIGITFQQIVSSTRIRNLHERVTIAVTAMANSRGIVVPRATS